MRCEHEHDDGAYVLGALSPAERVAYERHLATCSFCREAVRDISTHTDWMAEARSLRLVAGRPNRVGALYECDTRIGPLRTLDVMEVTRWRRGRSIGVRHVGIVTGSGRFTLRRRGRRRTRFTWKERLTVPWTLGGPFGAFVGGRVLKLVWRRNLRRLKRQIEAR